MPMMPHADCTYGAMDDAVKDEAMSPLVPSSTNVKVEVVTTPTASRAAGEWYGAVGLGGLVVMALAYAGLSGSPSSSKAVQQEALVGTPSSSKHTLGGPPSLTVSNAYERDVLGHAVGDGLFWDHIVERFRPTVLEVKLRLVSASSKRSPSTLMPFTHLFP